MSGSIILLNGTSSSGKCSTAVEVQRLMPSPWIVLSADRVLGGFPFNHPACEPDEVWRPLGQLFYETIGRFAGAGFDVIAEQVFQDKRQLEDAVVQLATQRLWFVGVHCDIEVAEARERGRSDGTLAGTARHELELVHRHAIYDIEVDTSNTTAAQVAEAIIRGLVDEPTAFRELQQR